MPSINEYKTRINSVKNTGKVTRAMQLIAAAKLRNYINTLDRSRLTLKTTLEMLSAAESAEDKVASSELTRELIIVVGSDKGLNGSYSSRLRNFAKKHHDQNTDLVMVGKSTAKGMKNLVSQTILQSDFLDPLTRKALVNEWLQSVKGGEYKGAKIIFSKFISALKQEPIILPLSPITGDTLAEVTGSLELELANEMEYDYEPNREQVVTRLRALATETIISYVLASSVASEESSRMLAMQAATKSAGEIVDDLQLQYNKFRQAAVTQEITEIVSGVNAMQI